MEVSGFVLAGGASSRMGRDKALLAYRGTSLLDHIASLVRRACGSAIIVGDPARYSHLSYPVVPDFVSGCGPLAGVITALQVSNTEWNLVVACDMPALSLGVLRSLLDAAAQSRAHCVAATGPGGEGEPLCAVYHQDCLPILEQALRDNRLKMRDLLTEIRAETLPMEAGALANANTPAEWREFSDKPE